MEWITIFLGVFYTLCGLGVFNLVNAVLEGDDHPWWWEYVAGILWIIVLPILCGAVISLMDERD